MSNWMGDKGLDIQMLLCRYLDYKTRHSTVILVEIENEMGLDQVNSRFNTWVNDLRCFNLEYHSHQKLYMYLITLRMIMNIEYC